ncbi:MAG TPA: lipocalin-like domain-containing protein [Longimicrobiales bacterium]
MTRRQSTLLVLLLAAAGCGRDADTPRTAALSIGELLGGSDTLHARALEPQPLRFPEDHGPHPAFRTEWWYFTGNLTAADGRELGYQLTFFRSALTDSLAFARLPQERSAWRTRHAYMAHFAVTDARAGELHAAERFARAARGLAGATVRPLRVNLGSWSAASTGIETFPLRLRASAAEMSIDLVLEYGKPVVAQGENGLSTKGPEPGNASYYYSLTRMPTRGTVHIGPTSFDVTGASWLDREWSTSALSAHLEGWDWMALQLDDSTELMTYRLRRHDGSADPFSAATFVARDGRARALTADQFAMTPLDTWRNADGVAYPIAWLVEVPALDLRLDVAAAAPDQELDLSVRYWEGMVRVRGTRAGRRVGGRGYLEMTGYVEPPEQIRR